MKTLTIVATFQARPGKETALRDALTDMLVPTRKEPGCINYDLHVSADDPARFLMHENWRSKADIDAHMKSAHVAALIPRVGDLCAVPPEIKIWERIG